MSVRVIHVFKDNTVSYNMENKVIKVEGNEELYRKLENIIMRKKEKVSKT